MRQYDVNSPLLNAEQFERCRCSSRLERRRVRTVITKNVGSCMQSSRHFFQAVPLHHVVIHLDSVASMQ